MDYLYFSQQIGGSTNAILNDALTGIAFDRVETPVFGVSHIYLTGSNGLVTRVSVSGLTWDGDVPTGGVVNDANISWDGQHILGISFSRTVLITELYPLLVAAGEGDYAPIDAFMDSFGLSLNAQSAPAGVQFVAGDNPDALFGSNFDDQLIGGNGNDVFSGYAGNDLIDGGEGYDFIDYGPLIGGPIHVDLTAGTVSKPNGDVDQITSVERIRGTVHDDSFIGDDGTNIFSANIGDDTADFGKGIDILQIEWNRSGFILDLVAGTAMHDTFGYGTKSFSGVEYIAFSDVLIELEEHTNIGGNLGADLLVQASSGAIRYIEGLTGSLHYVAHASGREVVGIGDFNADGTDDLLYRNGNDWYGHLDGAGANTNIGFRSGLSLMAVGDYTGDGRDDLLFRSDSSGWYSMVEGDGTFSNVGFRHGESLKGLGDFNGDGATDILFQRDSSGWYAYVDGATRATVNVGFRPGQTLLATGDFDGDGRDDLLFQSDSSGWVSYVKGAQDGAPYTVGLGVRTVEFIGVGDFNDDGKDDILFQSATSGWMSFIEGGSGANVNIGFAPQGHHVVSIADFDGDGSSDLLMQHETSGEATILRGADRADQIAVRSLADYELLSADLGTNVGDDVFIA